MGVVFLDAKFTGSSADAAGVATPPGNCPNLGQFMPSQCNPPRDLFITLKRGQFSPVQVLRAK
jgi:hypothetical protein